MCIFETFANTKQHVLIVKNSNHAPVACNFNLLLIALGIHFCMNIIYDTRNVVYLMRQYMRIGKFHEWINMSMGLIYWLNTKCISKANYCHTDL